MRKRALIVIGVVLAAALLAGVVGAWAYDHSRRETIASGARVAGVDVGGLEAERARAVLRKRLLARLRQPIVATFRGQRAVLSPTRARLAIDIDNAVEEALKRSREGWFVARAARDLTGATAEIDVSPRITYSRPAVDGFVATVAERFSREPRDASIELTGTSVAPVESQDGIAVRKRPLRQAVVRALTNADAPRRIPVRAKVVKPQVTTAQLAQRYPVVITVDRSSFQLRLWKDLRLVKTYRIAVGQVGLETPAGLYSIQNKAVNPAWHVPNSEWAGDLAGKVIPPGPDNPIKARWMGIYDGAGIHGTDAVNSLGTAASHGCIRMAVPDVIELYDQTPVGAPVYIA